MLNGGISFNVVPSEMSAAFDIRIPPTVDLKVCSSAIKRPKEQGGVDLFSACETVAQNALTQNWLG